MKTPIKFASLLPETVYNVSSDSPTPMQTSPTKVVKEEETPIDESAIDESEDSSHDEVDENFDFRAALKRFRK